MKKPSILCAYIWWKEWMNCSNLGLFWFNPCLRILRQKLGFRNFPLCIRWWLLCYSPVKKQIICLIIILPIILSYEVYLEECPSGLSLFRFTFRFFIFLSYSHEFTWIHLLPRLLIKLLDRDKYSQLKTVSDLYMKSIIELKVTVRTGCSLKTSPHFSFSRRNDTVQGTLLKLNALCGSKVPFIN